MQLAELALDLLECLGPAITIGDVVLDGEHAGVPGLEQRQRRLQALLVAVADADLHPGIGGGARDTESNSVGRGGHVGHLALQIAQRCGLRNLRLRRHRRTSAGSARTRWRAGLRGRRVRHRWDPGWAGSEPVRSRPGALGKEAAALGSEAIQTRGRLTGILQA